jgi:hypothetical protein
VEGAGALGGAGEEEEGAADGEEEGSGEHFGGVLRGVGELVGCEVGWWCRATFFGSSEDDGARSARTVSSL